jgi:formylglycine-generating enzyme required for sulfatase activity
MTTRKILNPAVYLRTLILIAALAMSGSMAAASEVGCSKEQQTSSPGVHGIQDGMIYISGGEYNMGFEAGHDDESPVHQVRLAPFYIDRYEVTNREFTEFVNATGYITKAEQDGLCWGFLEGNDKFQQIQGANWQHPEGPQSSVETRLNHPVVCVNWHDAAAYAKWAGKRLPTEAEWEYAARAGTEDQYVAINDMNSMAMADGYDPKTVHYAIAGNRNPFANDQTPSSKSHGKAAVGHVHHRTTVGESLIEANIWQGGWPEVNQRADGYFYTAPVGSYDSNEWGINDMIGNVWEWTSDWYDEKYYLSSPSANPPGPADGEKRVARGGSWFCNPTYCGAYSTHYRGASPPERGFNNVGFRCAADVPGNTSPLGTESRQ